jgi:DNA-binding CsgD family transcriptional regulator
LRWATAAENSQDAIDHGAVVHGERHPMAKLSETDAETILSMKSKKRPAEIARLFGIHPATVRSIIRGAAWKHLRR